MYQAPSAPRRDALAGRRANASRSCGVVIAMIAAEKNVPRELLMAPRRSKLPVARARQLAMYLSHVVLGHTLLDIGKQFGRDRTTVSYACALIEDMRDDPRFDAEVTLLEQRIDEEATRHAAQHA
ncbi:MAG TPA: helix-turn-helix domain-containing protein [Devosia sp.]|nr:helix-turn-helix domain-containing protein [Devosia sp.]